MAQQAYVAAGQGDEFWGSKVADADRLVAGRARSAPRSGCDTASAGGDRRRAAALDDFERMDARAREYTRGNQRLLASDLIFSDGLEKTDGDAEALVRRREPSRPTTSRGLDPGPVVSVSC